MRRQPRSAYNTAYNTAREYPGTIAAIIVGIGVTAALLWAARRAGGWSNLQEDAKLLAQQGIEYARDGVNRIRNRSETVTD